LEVPALPPPPPPQKKKTTKKSLPKFTLRKEGRTTNDRETGRQRANINNGNNATAEANGKAAAFNAHRARLRRRHFTFLPPATKTISYQQPHHLLLALPFAHAYFWQMKLPSFAVALIIIITIMNFFRTKDSFRVDFGFFSVPGCLRKGVVVPWI